MASSKINPSNGTGKPMEKQGFDPNKTGLSIPKNKLSDWSLRWCAQTAKHLGQVRPASSSAQSFGMPSQGEHKQTIPAKSACSQSMSQDSGESLL